MVQEYEVQPSLVGRPSGHGPRVPVHQQSVLRWLERGERLGEENHGDQAQDSRATQARAPGLVARTRTRALPCILYRVNERIGQGLVVPGVHSAR